MVHQMQSLDATIEALGEGVTSLDLSVAIDIIEGWRAELQSTKQPQLLVVAAELNTLRGLLEVQPLDGKAIGEALQRVGQRTMTAAAIGGFQSGKIYHVGMLLSKAGTALNGGK